jgi:hypothetical protein
MEFGEWQIHHEKALERVLRPNRAAIFNQTHHFTGVTTTITTQISSHVNFHLL